MHRCFLVAIALLHILQSCQSKGYEANSIDFVIVPLHDPNQSFNPETESIDSCEDRDCGSPISVFYSDGKIQHVKTSGSQGRMLAISPNRQHLAISDIYGIHVANSNKITTYKKNEITASVRGISISDTGDFVSVEHIGSREINGKSGFASLIVWRHNSNVEQKTEVIDGDLIDCGNNPRLYSFGDEKDEKTNLYQFSFENGSFKHIGNINNIDNFSPIAYYCNNNNSLIAYGSVNGFLKYAKIEGTNSTFQSSEVNYEEIPTPPHQSLSTSHNLVYYATQPGNIHTYDTNLDKVTKSINVNDLIPVSLDPDSTTMSLQGNLAFILSKDATSKKWLASKIDIDSNKLLYSSENEYLDSNYKDDLINHLFIFNSEGFSSWIKNNR